MMVEKVPDSTYEMVGGLEKQIKEIKEVSAGLKEWVPRLCSTRCSPFAYLVLLPILIRTRIYI